MNIKSIITLISTFAIIAIGIVSITFIVHGCCAVADHGMEPALKQLWEGKKGK